jgi:hypothetical protein
MSKPCTRGICLLTLALITPHALSQDISGWSDKTVCRLVKSNGSEDYLDEAASRGLDCKAKVKASGSNTSGSVAFSETPEVSIQKILLEQGYYAGTIDEKFGSKSKKALASFCKSKNINCSQTTLDETLVFLENNGFKSEPLYPVPVFEKFNFSIKNPNVLLVDVNKDDFSRCEYTIKNNLKKYPYDTASVYNNASLLFEKDIYKASGKNFDVIDEVTNNFVSRMYKQGHACLKGESKACQATFEVIEKMRERDALTQNTTNSTPETHFLTNSRILSPLLVSYSYAVQRLGRPKSDFKNSIWFKNALYQNTYDPRPKARNRERDFERTNLGDCEVDLKSAAGQNHHTVSGLLYQMWGVLWNHNEYAAVGLDAVNAALKSVDSKGALVCDAVRGSNAMTYSGSNLSNMVSSLTIAKNQGFDSSQLSHLNSLHLAVKFQISLIYDQRPIYSYAKRNTLSWCSSDYKKQCFHIAGRRDLAFAWVIPYMKLFPQHENTKWIKSIFNQMSNEIITDEEIKRNLNAFVAGKIPTDNYRKNIVYQNQWDIDDSSLYIYDDFDVYAKGSPVCMYGIPKY